MKNIFVACALLITSLHAHSQIQEEFDRFRNVTTLKYDNTKPSGGMRFYALSAFEGTSKESKRENAITFVSSSSDWKYLRCNHTSILVDGKPFPIAKINHDGSVGRGYVLEFLSLTLSTSSMQTLGAAKTVEYKICNDEFKFTDEDLRAFRELVEGAKPDFAPTSKQEPKKKK